MPTGVKFNQTIAGKYTASFRINQAKRSVEVKGLDININGEEIERTELFKLKLPTHFIG